MDFSLPSNRFVALATPVAGVVAGSWALIAGSDLAGAVGYGIAAGGAAFLAWAAARELDPDRPGTAAVAALAAPWVVVLGRPSLLACALWLLAIRMVAGTTGVPPSRVDLAVIVALAGLVAARDDGLVPAAVGMAVVAVAALADSEGRRRLLVGATVGCAGVAATSMLWGDTAAPLTPDGVTWLRLATIAVLAAFSMRVTVRSETDRRPMAISTSRVRVARVAAGAAAGVALAWHGDAGLHAVAPVAVALGVVAVGAIGRRYAPSGR
jgi:hypothetical protein